MDSLADASLSGDYLLASYYAELEPSQDALAVARKFAVGQTVGTWLRVPGAEGEKMRRRTGRVANIREIPPMELSSPRRSERAGRRRLIFDIEFPWENFGGSLSMLLTALLGMDASTSIRAKLIDLLIPKEYAALFPGPAFGEEGTRKALSAGRGVDNGGDFLILNMIKPCLGFSPEEGAALFAEAAQGRPDLIKDDELLSNPSYCPIGERTRAYLEKAPGAPYCPNVTASEAEALKMAREAKKNGAAAVMVNFVFAGLDTVKSLASANLGLPLMVHYAGAGGWFESPYSGICSTLLLGKLPRLAGADMIHLPSPYGSYPFSRERAVLAAAAQRLPWHHLKSSLPVLGGGLIPGQIPGILADFGPSVMLAVGGAVQGHPDGPAAGVEAIREAGLSAQRGEKLWQAAKRSPALAAALKAWGPPEALEPDEPLESTESLSPSKPSEPSGPFEPEPPSGGEPSQDG